MTVANNHSKHAHLQNHIINEYCLNSLSRVCILKGSNPSNSYYYDLNIVCYHCNNKETVKLTRSIV